MKYSALAIAVFAILLMLLADRLGRGLIEVIAILVVTPLLLVLGYLVFAATKKKEEDER